MKKVLVSALLAGLSISAFAELRVAVAPGVSAPKYMMFPALANQIRAENKVAM